VCACGCFLVAGILAAIVYCVIHALWLPLAGLIVFAAVIGWFGQTFNKKKKAAANRTPPRV
jgi:hypothetical protein